MQKLIANTQTATAQKMRNPSINSISFISVVSFPKTSLINVVVVEFIALPQYAMPQKATPHYHLLQHHPTN